MKIKGWNIGLVLLFLAMVSCSSNQNLDQSIVEVGRIFDFEVKKVQYFTRNDKQNISRKGIDVELASVIDSSSVFNGNYEFLVSLFALQEFKMLDSLGRSKDFDIFSFKCYINDRHVEEVEYPREDLELANLFEKKFNDFFQVVELSDLSKVNEYLDKKVLNDSTIMVFVDAFSGKNRCGPFNRKLITGFQFQQWEKTGDRVLEFHKFLIRNEDRAKVSLTFNCKTGKIINYKYKKTLFCR